MIEALARFAEALRVDGVSASPAELLDAVHALQALDLGRRAQVKAALRATLAKNRKQALVFDRVFDGFFVPPAGVAAERKGKQARHGERSKRGRIPPKTEGRGERRGPEARERGPRKALRVVRAQPEAKGERRDAPSGVEAPKRRILAASLTPKEEATLAREIPRLIQQIRLKGARRLRRAPAGRLWPARVFRDSLATGGVPFVLPFRQRHPRRPRVVLLVDVSWSVARAAGFFLWIASEFLRIGRDTRVLAFVDRPVDATDRVRRWLGRGRGMQGNASRIARPGAGIVRRGVSFAALLDGIHDLNLDAASDYGRAFHAVLRDGLEGGRRDTLLVILGDGRSNRFEPLPWTLDELSRRCRAILWLASEPASRWGTGDSRLSEYLAHVDVLVEAGDLDGIARGVGEILRRI